MEKIETCEHRKYSARWGTKGWVCDNCGEEVECSVKYTKEDLTPKEISPGVWGQPDKCCPLAPHTK